MCWHFILTCTIKYLHETYTRLRKPKLNINPRRLFHRANGVFSRLVRVPPQEDV
jgi:hypothetical protein